MCGLIICLSAAALGVDYGWQPVAGGGIEYIIQIEPELLDSLKAGHDLFSDLPPAMRNIRSYRITVGAGRLPHHGEPPPSAAESNGIQGRSAAAAAADISASPPGDIDLTQLPGPVLGPALVLHPPANRLEADEPPRLAANEAKPLASRVAGYHGKPDAPLSADDAHVAPTEERPAAVLATKNDKQQGKSPAAVAVKTTVKTTDTGKQGPAAAAHAPVDGQSPQGSAVMQLGLFTSLCANAFLLWVAAGQRSSYRALLRRMFDRQSQEQKAVAEPNSADTPRDE
ncbi:MAG TPA: hypothetical protein VF278_11710, partial [Pirellulales bacterium]